MRLRAIWKRAACVLNEYLALTAGRDLTAATEDALAVLQARVARAEGDWRAVIELLRPVATRAADNVDAWLLLSEAYASTNPAWTPRLRRCAPIWMRVRATAT